MLCYPLPKQAAEDLLDWMENQGRRGRIRITKAGLFRVEEKFPGRDPARIPVVLDRVREIWVKYPDLRLGQLICILNNLYHNSVDPFYLEDEDLLKAIEVMASKLN